MVIVEETSHGNLVLKRALDPGTGIGRLAGKGGWTRGMWLGTANGCCPLAKTGGGTQSCSAWDGTLPAI